MIFKKMQKFHIFSKQARILSYFTQCLIKNALQRVALSKNVGWRYSPILLEEGNRAIASEQALNKNVIGSLKRFKIFGDKYRNRRKRFGLHLNLITGIYNRDNVSKW